MTTLIFVFAIAVTTSACAGFLGIGLSFDDSRLPITSEDILSPMTNEEKRRLIRMAFLTTLLATVLWAWEWHLMLAFPFEPGPMIAVVILATMLGAFVTLCYAVYFLFTKLIPGL